MANVDSPRGFAFYKTFNGNRKAPIQYFDYTSSATAIFKGALVKLTSGFLTAINGTFASDSAANGTCVGICQEYIAANAASKINVPVVPIHDCYFSVQADDNWAITSRPALQVLYTGANEYPITNPTSGSTTLGRSSSELDGANPAASSYLRVVGFDDFPGNEFAPFQKIIVRFNELLFQRSPIFNTLA